MSKSSKAVAKEMRKQRTRDAMAKRASKRDNGNSFPLIGQLQEDTFIYSTDESVEWYLDDYLETVN